MIGVVAICAYPKAASAHFVLQAPESWMSQDSQGNPQKTGPCGNESGGTSTGKVTAFQPGQKITVTVNETVYHPGHYRVALSVANRSELPAVPAVTAGSTACGSVPIMTTPTFPVLADGMLPHTSQFSGAQSFQVTLPSNVTCTKCTLQIIEFMSNHSAPCFYYHCADISIQGAAVDGGASDAGARDSGADAPTDGTAGSGGAQGSGGTGGPIDGSSGSGGNGGTGGIAGATGGTTGTGGGASASGGAQGATGGMSSGSGGAVSASGGAVGSGGAANNTGGTQGTSSSGSSSGCGCSASGPAGGSALSLFGTWVLLALAGLRVRRR